MEDKKKDLWDKFSTLTPFITTLIVVIGGTCLTQKYQASQQAKDDELKQINILVQLMPYLSSKDTIQNRAAIYAIRSLGYDSLAVELGSRINSVGTRYAIRDLSHDSTLPFTQRKIYMDKWDKLKTIPPVSVKPKSSVQDSIKYLINEDGNFLLTQEGKKIPL